MTYPNQPTQPAGQPPQPPEPNVSKRAVRIAWMVGGGILVFGLGATVGAAGGGDNGGTASPAETVTVTVTAEPEPAADDDKAEPAAEETTAKPKPKPTKPAGPPTEFGDGTYKVGADVAAGTYRTGGPSDSAFPNCYWARTKDASGEFGSIIANGNPGGPSSVTINTGEYIESSGCETWKKVG